MHQKPSKALDQSYPHRGCEEIIIAAGVDRLEYRILISPPVGDAPSGGYPVIYALDGHAIFHTLAETARLQTRKPHGFDPVLIVAIGYPSGEPFDMTRRCYDFTLPAEKQSLPKRKDGKEWPEHGGADHFLDLLQEEIMPMISDLYVVDKQRQALFGHSLGGLLVLHALYTRPALFTHYAAGSPSIWWGDYVIQSEQERFLTTYVQMRLNRKLLITVGGDEHLHMVVDAEKLPRQLEPLAAYGLQVQMIKFPEEGHISVLPAALSRLLKFALNDV